MIKEKTNKKSGISLIVLVITIIVVIILAVAVILSITNNNPIQNAKKAVFLNDIKTMQDELDIYLAKKFADENGKYDKSLLNASIESLYENGVEVTNSNITKILSNFKDEFKDKIEIIEGKLSYIGTYKEEDGVVTPVDIQSSWIEESDVNIVKNYTEDSNIMRTDEVKNIKVLHANPTYDFPERVNDGVKSSVFGGTYGAKAEQNIGFGVEVEFNREIALKKLIWYSYGKTKATEYTISAYVDGAWQEIKTHVVTKSPNTIDLSTNTVKSTKWKLEISSVNDANSNYYAYEMEAYI